MLSPFSDRSPFPAAQASISNRPGDGENLRGRFGSEPFLEKPPRRAQRHRRAAMPAGTIEDHHGVGIGGGLAADLAEMMVHGGGIADWHDPLCPSLGRERDHAIEPRASS
jgi:hypothetical protein